MKRARKKSGLTIFIPINVLKAMTEREQKILVTLMRILGKETK